MTKNKKIKKIALSFVYLRGEGAVDGKMPATLIDATIVNKINEIIDKLNDNN